MQWVGAWSPRSFTIARLKASRSVDSQITVRLKPDTTEKTPRSKPDTTYTELYTNPNARVGAHRTPVPCVCCVPLRPGARPGQSHPAATSDRAHHDRHAAGGPARVV